MDRNDGQVIAAMAILMVLGVYALMIFCRSDCITDAIKGKRKKK